MISVNSSMTQPEVARAAQAAKLGGVSQARPDGYSLRELAGIDMDDFREKWAQVASTGKALEERGEVQEDGR